MAVRPMLSADLGDPRLYEDEAIREQAAALQMHLNNLARRLERIGTISGDTEWRIYNVRMAGVRLHNSAVALHNDHPL